MKNKSPVTRLFEDIADKSPDADIVTDAPTKADGPRPSLTARQLNQRANKLAR